MGQCADGRLWLQDPGLWAACWAPTRRGKSPEAAQQLSPQEFSCPHKGPPDMELLLLGNTENIILPLCCHPTPRSEPVILHVQSRQPVSRSCSSEPLAQQSRSSWSTKWPDCFCVLLALEGCRDCSGSDTDWSHLWADLTRASCQAPKLDLVL